MPLNPRLSDPMAKDRVPPSGQSFPLTGDLDVFCIHDQWERLLARIEAQEGSLSVDLSGAGDLDLSGVQLLLAAERAMKMKKANLTFEGWPGSWKDRFGPVGWPEWSGRTEP